MRKVLVFCAALAAGIVAYAGWPWFGVYQLALAVQSGDPEAVVERVDVDSVRRHLVHQVLGPVLNETLAASQVRGIDGELARTVGLNVIDARIAELFPPDEIARLIITGVMPQEVRSAAGAAPVIPSLDRLAEAPIRSIQGWNYVSLSKFRIAAGDETRKTEPIWLTFRLQQLTWKLWSVELPSSIVERIRPGLQARLASKA